ncbi:hypothetical protein ACIRTB_20940 [Streptomyces sp. NPDC101158]|uniref:hypothetical protein n=1 Tax=Streptomyces sp. NPDC101158 TaxID=3366117 RepID=UPI003828BA27
MYAQTAPDPIYTVAEEIRSHRRHLTSGRKLIDKRRTEDQIIGKFQGVASATVQADLQIVFSESRKKDGSPFDQNPVVKFAALVRCFGHGCPTPEHKVPATTELLLDADADETAPAALPVIAAARKWAQQHAETCRALPYTGR